MVDAVAEAAYQNAERFAIAAVEETGMGVAEHKRRKNEACSRGIVERYAVGDYVDAQVDADAKIVAVPKPAGVVLALTPSTNPIATVYFKVLLALMTRNAVVVSPHPLARKTSRRRRPAARARRGRGRRARRLPAGRRGADDPADRGADGRPRRRRDRRHRRHRRRARGLPLGQPVARRRARQRARRSSTPPPTSPRPPPASPTRRRSTTRSCARTSRWRSSRSGSPTRSSASSARNGAHVLDEEEAQRARDALYPDGRIDTKLAGKDAAALAAAAEIKVPPKTRVLVAPFPLIVPEEPLALEKLFPLLGLVRVPDAARGIDAARALLRIGGAGHSAVIHSRDPRTILAYGAAVGVLRVVGQRAREPGLGGLDTNLAPTMTVGTGFFGRSALTENLQPRHLTQWTRLAYAPTDEPLGDFDGLQPWSVRPEPAPVVACRAPGRRADPRRPAPR